MNVKSSVRNIISEISSVMEEIDENTVEEVISEILKANKIFIALTSQYQSYVYN